MNIFFNSKSFVGWGLGCWGQARPPEKVWHFLQQVFFALPGPRPVAALLPGRRPTARRDRGAECCTCAASSHRNYEHGAACGVAGMPCPSLCGSHACPRQPVASLCAPSYMRQPVCSNRTVDGWPPHTQTSSTSSSPPHHTLTTRISPHNHAHIPV